MLVLMRCLRVPVAAAVLFTVSLTACSSDGASSPSTTKATGAGRALTSDEAAIMANLLKKNFDSGGAKFVAKVPFGPSVTFNLTGSINYQGDQAEAVLEAESTGQPTQTSQLYWTSTMVAEEIAGLTTAMQIRGFPGVRYMARELTTSSAQDVVLQFISKTGSNVAENPLLIQQNPEAKYLRNDVLNGEPVDVLQFGRSTYFVGRSDGLLRRVETLLSIAEGTTTIDFTSHEKVAITGPTQAEVIEMSQVPADVLDLLATGSAGPVAPAVAPSVTTS